MQKILNFFHVLQYNKKARAGFISGIFSGSFMGVMFIVAPHLPFSYNYLFTFAISLGATFAFFSYIGYKWIKKFLFETCYFFCGVTWAFFFIGTFWWGIFHGVSTALILGVSMIIGSCMGLMLSVLTKQTN